MMNGQGNVVAIVTYREEVIGQEQVHVQSLSAMISETCLVKTVGIVLSGS